MFLLLMYFQEIVSTVTEVTAGMVLFQEEAEVAGEEALQAVVEAVGETEEYG